MSRAMKSKIKDDKEREHNQKKGGNWKGERITLGADPTSAS